MRPQNEMALQIDNTKRFLELEAKINEKSKCQDIAMTVRIINGYNEHWEYARYPNTPILIQINEPNWQKYQVDLNSPDNWHLFMPASDSSASSKVPVFDILAGIVFGFGSFIQGSIYPREGDGIVDIRSIKVVE